MIGVGPSYRNKNIAQKMNYLNLENAQKYGYTTVTVVAWTPAAQHIFKKQGFQERLRFDYKFFKSVDSQVCERLKPWGDFLVFEKSLERRIERQDPS